MVTNQNIYKLRIIELCWLILVFLAFLALVKRGGSLKMAVVRKNVFLELEKVKKLIVGKFVDLNK